MTDEELEAKIDELIKECYSGKDAKYNEPSLFSINWLQLTPEQKLSAATKLMKFKGADERYYLVLLDEGLNALNDLPKNKIGPDLDFANAARTFINEYTETPIIKTSKAKIEKKQELEKDAKKKQNDYETSATKYNMVKKIQDAWKLIDENTTIEQSEALKTEVEAFISKVIDNINKGLNSNITIKTPESKIPFLFGRRKAERKQQNLNEAIRTLNEIFKTGKLTKDVLTLKDLGIEYILGGNTLEELEKEKLNKQKEVKEAKAKVTKMGYLWVENSNLGWFRLYIDRCASIETIMSNREEFQHKLDLLKYKTEIKIEDASDERGMPRSERQQPPKTPEGKKTSALTAYAARRRTAGKK